MQDISKFDTFPRILVIGCARIGTCGRNHAPEKGAFRVHEKISRRLVELDRRFGGWGDLTWSHLISLPLSLAFTGSHMLEVGLNWSHMVSLGLTRSHVVSLDFT